jgi:hypothetical protein
MLPPSVAAPSANAVMQQYSLNALKRAHGGEIDAGDPRKQAKTVDVADTKLLLPSTNAHPK